MHNANALSPVYVLYAVVSQETWYVVSEEQVEQDALNTHESMLALMRLLDHMEHNNINPAVPKV